MYAYSPRPDRSYFRLLLAAGLLASTAAGARDLDPQVKQYVISTCSGDAYRLCPQSLTSEKDAVSCMKTKRRELGPACRMAYDKAARLLAQ